MQIVTIVGARPQFIKAAAVSRAVLNYKGIKEILVHTGQHYDDNMSKLFFEELDIPKPKINLKIVSNNHGQQTAKMLEGIEKVLLDIKPNCVLIYGDTNSTLAGALAASKLHIPVAHIEAGLRSFNRKMPEEINRIVADKVANFLFTPTNIATKNLIKEGVPPTSIFQVGDVMYDVALFYEKYLESSSIIIKKMFLKDDSYILATIHRAENTDNVSRLKNIFKFLNILAKEYKIILPLHPRTRKKLIDANIDYKSTKNILFIEPVGYLDMMSLEKHAKFIITDSGGIQKEAFFHKKPCLTLRDETEWIELVKAGWNKFISPINDVQLMYTSAKSFLDTFNPKEKFFYGKGNSADLIVKALQEQLN